jgi:ammonium transporter, Amt family
MAVLLATVLALATIPGLALFYGGIVGAPVRMAAFSFAGLVVAAAVWFAYGRGLVFNVPLLDGLMGNPLGRSGPLFGLDPVTTSAFGVASAFVAVSVVGSAVAGRMRMGGWLVFAVLWISLVFLPVSYWVLNEGDGWAAGMLVADLGGGAYVHIVAGAAALALLVVLGKQQLGWLQPGVQRRGIRPLWPGASLVGALLLCAGWLGLNVAAEGVIDDVSARIVVNSLAAPLSGVVGWLLAEALSTGTVSRSAAAEGMVAGLVAIAPACGSFAPGWAVALGLLSGAVCAFTVLASRRRGRAGRFIVPDIHLVGATIGMLSIGVFGDSVGFIYNGNPAQSIAQISVIVVVAGYSFAVTALLGWLICGRMRSLGPQSRESAVMVPPTDTGQPKVDSHGSNQPA